MNDLVVREMMNGTWFILSLALMIVFVSRVVQHRSAHGPGWYWQQNSQAAIALSVFFAGSVVRAAWIWALLSCQAGYLTDCSVVRSSGWAGVLASALAVTGCLCCIRVFTPVRLNPWLWISIGIVAVIVPVVVHLYFAN